MSIIEKIKDSVETATGLTMYYHAVGQINEIFDNVLFPAAYSFLIESASVADVNGMFHERVTLGVFFCDKTEFDFNAMENESIIQNCKEKAFAWLYSLRTNSDFSSVAVNSTQRVYDQFDVNVTGFGVNVTIEESEGFGKCDIE